MTYNPNQTPMSPGNWLGFDPLLEAVPHVQRALDAELVDLERLGRSFDEVFGPTVAGKLGARIAAVHEAVSATVGQLRAARQWADTRSTEEFRRSEHAHAEAVRKLTAERDQAIRVRDDLRQINRAAFEERDALRTISVAMLAELEEDYQRRRRVYSTRVQRRKAHREAIKVLAPAAGAF